MTTPRVTTTGDPGFTCFFCEQRFQNAQAVKAHLKGCPLYRVTRHVELQKAHDMNSVEGVNKNQSRKRPFSTEDLLLFMEVSDELSALLKDIYEHVTLSRDDNRCYLITV